MLIQYLPCLVAFISALAVALLHAHSKLRKLLASAGCIMVLWATAVMQSNWERSAASMSVLVLVAVACVIGQRNAKHAAVSTAMIPFVLGLLSTILYGDSTSAQIAQGVLLFTLAALSVLFRKNSSLGFGSAAAFGTAMVSLVLASVMHGSASVVFQVVAAAALLPLFPLHVGYVGVLSNLPGTLPAFLAFAMPLAGWHALMAVSILQTNLAPVIFSLAVVGAFLTSIRAFAQSALGRIVGAVGSLLLLPAWWLFASLGKLGSEGGAYVAAVGLVISGLVLCAHAIASRYGSQVLQPGLAKAMPKFGVSFSLLVMAGAGIPAFAVFSGFMLIVVTSLGSDLTDLLFFSLIWLASFAIQVSALQRLLFNEPRSNLAYTDLSGAEAMSLAVIIALLVVGGVCPAVMLGLAT